MDYCTVENLVDAHGQDMVDRLSIRPGDEDGSRSVASALAYANGLIDAALSVRFALPLSTLPQMLTSIAQDVAIMRLADTADQATDLILDRAKRARADLKEIADGKMNLGLPALGPADSPRPVLGRVVQGREKLFTRDDLRGL